MVHGYLCTVIPAGAESPIEGEYGSLDAMIDAMSEEELFQPHKRKWADDATKTAVWEVYKFIHVNTVAPFGTFRTKIRKWKKLALRSPHCCTG